MAKRIDRLAAADQLEMQMGACGMTGVADVSDQLAAHDGTAEPASASP